MGQFPVQEVPGLATSSRAPSQMPVSAFGARTSRNNIVGHHQIAGKYQIKAVFKLFQHHLILFPDKVDENTHPPHTFRQTAVQLKTSKAFHSKP